MTERREGVAGLVAFGGSVVRAGALAGLHRATFHAQQRPRQDDELLDALTSRVPLSPAMATDGRGLFYGGHPRSMNSAAAAVEAGETAGQAHHTLTQITGTQAAHTSEATKSAVGRRLLTGRRPTRQQTV